MPKAVSFSIQALLANYLDGGASNYKKGRLLISLKSLYLANFLNENKHLIAFQLSDSNFRLKRLNSENDLWLVTKPPTYPFILEAL